MRVGSSMKCNFDSPMNRPSTAKIQPPQRLSGRLSEVLFLESHRKRQPTHHQTYGNANNGLACGGQDAAGGQNQMNGEGDADNHADETGVF